MNTMSWLGRVAGSSSLAARLAILLIVFSVCPTIAHGAVEEGFEYELNLFNTVTIKRYVGAGGDVTIPEHLGGRLVTSIGQTTFAGVTNVSRVIVPASVAGIGVGAFSGCTGLIAIDVDAFNPNFSSLDGVLFDKTRSILFACPAGKLGAYVIPNSVTRLMYKAFFGCGSLTSVTIGDGLNTLEELAFEGCSSLTQISIARGVTSIGVSSFSACTSLLSIDVDPMNPAYRSLDGVLLERNRAELLLFPPGRAGLYIVPAGVTNLGAYSFWDCANLGGISISNDVSSIGDFAFSGCASLTNVALSSSVRSIGAGAFVACNGLKNFEIPNSVAAIAKATFVDCSNLTTVTVPSSVTSIGDSAFWGCSSLKNIIVPDGVTSIGDSAFIDCRSLVSMVIPDSITAIGNSVFQGCTGLTNVMIPDGVTTIGTAAFTYCSSLKSILIPDTVISIGDFGFGYCSGLTNVRLPSSLEAIPDHAFYGCSALTNLTIPSSVTSIGTSAFGNCAGLVAVTIPAGVSSIGDHAFQYCTALIALNFQGGPPLLNGDPFNSWPLPTFVTVFYQSGTVGWESTFGGRPTAVWAPQADYGEWAVTTGLTSKYPNANGESDDPDGDGFNNRSEWYSGTDPTRSDSRLELEPAPRTSDLVQEDRTPPRDWERALYFQSVPGRCYGLLRSSTLDGEYSLDAVRVAGGTQTRFVTLVGDSSAFYRVVALP